MTEAGDKILAGLSPVQREIAKYIGDCCIVAGAGSGKTRVITHKIAWLIETGQAFPMQICALAFTKKAANVMEERIKNLIDRPVKGLVISTIHSFGMRFIRSNLVEARKVQGIEPNFTVCDSDSKMRIVKKLMKAYGLNVRDAELAKNVASNISSVLYSEVDPNYAARHRDAFPEITKAYRAYLRKNNCIDYDEMEVVPIKIMQQFPDIQKSYQKLYKWLFVDEYQDINNIQFLLITLLKCGNNYLNVVGDPDQAIYSFRGSDISYINGFIDTFPGSKLFKLEQNYRSTKSVVNVSNAVIAHNEIRIPKTVFTENEEGNQINFSVYWYDYTEAQAISKRIQKLVDSGEYKYSDIAILYRTNSQSQIYERFFVDDNIPYRLMRGVSFFERKEIKHIMAIFRVMLNPRDTVAMEYVADIFLHKVGEKSIAKINALLNTPGMEMEPIKLWKTMIRMHTKDLGIGKVAAESIKTFARDILYMLDLIEKSEESPIHDIMKYIMEDMGYNDYLEEDNVRNPDEIIFRKENIDELTKYFPTDVPFLDAVNDLVLNAELSIDSNNKDRDAVKLLTMHVSKGMEFPVVFLVGVCDKILPFSLAVEENGNEGIEEERRLFYVGMTRAEKLLYISSYVYRKPKGYVDENRYGMSEFFDEALAYSPDSKVYAIKFCDKDKTLGKATDANHIYDVISRFSFYDRASDDVKLKRAY